MYKYVIIDDELLTRKGTIEKLAPVANILQCTGEAEDGEQGLQLIEAVHPDLVITDMKMPVMDGTALLPVLAERYPKIALIVISGYQDFEYMRQAIYAKAIDYILKPFSTEDIVESVKKVIKKMELKETESIKSRLETEHYEKSRENYDLGIIRNIIEGHSTGNGDFVSRKIRFMFQERKIILITLYSEKNIRPEEIEYFMKENQYESSTLFVGHHCCDNIGFLILTFPQGEFLQENTFAKQVIKGISSLFWKYRQEVLYGISAVHTNISELTIAFKETMIALNQNRIDDVENIFEYSEQNIPPRRIPWKNMDKLIFSVEAGRVEETEKLVDELFEIYHGIPGLSIGDIKFNCYQISGQLRYMLSYSIPELQIMRTETTTQNAVSVIFGLAELYQYYRTFFTNIAHNFVTQEIYGDEDLINNVKTYIEHYYQKNVSVEIAASLFHVNRSYLSHIFKKKMGESFIDYLNKVRVKHAKELLVSSDKKMYQIALLSGYNNVRYFFRAFKKIEGMTPEQYRKSLLRNE